MAYPVKAVALKGYPAGLPFRGKARHNVDGLQCCVTLPACRRERVINPGPDFLEPLGRNAVPSGYLRISRVPALGIVQAGKRGLLEDGPIPPNQVPPRYLLKLPQRISLRASSSWVVRLTLAHHCDGVKSGYLRNERRPRWSPVIQNHPLRC